MLDFYKIVKIDFQNKKFKILFKSSEIKTRNENFLELECDDSGLVTDDEIVSYLETEIKKISEYENNKIKEIKNFLKEKEGGTIGFSFSKNSFENENSQTSMDIEIDIVYYEDVSQMFFIKPYCKKFKKAKDNYRLLSFHINDLVEFSNKKIENLILEKCENVILEYLNIEKNMEDVIFDESTIIVEDVQKDCNYKLDFIL